jgi:hypothetical protein
MGAGGHPLPASGAKWSTINRLFQFVHTIVLPESWPQAILVKENGPGDEEVNS